MESQSEAKPPTGSVDGNLAIGIDLGTWKCCVGVVREGKVEIIENERGSKTTPSYVAFTGTERLVGEDARLQATVNCANTVFGVKRIIGRSFDDSSLQNDVNAVFPFTVGNDNGKPVVEVTYRGEKKQLFPEQVSAMLLVKMKRIAESHLGCQVRDAVISVPAYFNNAQRQATKDAGAIAGLSVLGLINEPSAAALAYRDNKGPTDETICLVDLGGGTLDVSVIRMEIGEGITVLKTSGDTALGGMDFDQGLVEYFKEEFKKQHKADISGNKKALMRLQLACEKLKHALSLLRSENIHIDCLANGENFASSITREKFDSLFYETFETVFNSVIARTQMEKVDRIVVIGGSTRVSMIEQKLSGLHKKLDRSVNPDEAVAHGAAIHAANLKAGRNSVRDIYAHKIGYRTGEGKSKLLKTHLAPLPYKKSVWVEGNESTGVQFEVFEECFNHEKNECQEYSVGELEFGKVDDLYCLELVCKLNKDGMYSTEVKFPVLQNLSVKSMIDQEKDFMQEEKCEKKRQVVIHEVEAYIYAKKIDITTLNMPVGDREKFIKDCEDTLAFLDANPLVSKDECRSRCRKLEDLFKSLTDQARSETSTDQARSETSTDQARSQTSTDQARSQISTDQARSETSTEQARSETSTVGDQTPVSDSVQTGDATKSPIPIHGESTKVRKDDQQNDQNNDSTSQKPGRRHLNPKDRMCLDNKHSDVTKKIIEIDIVKLNNANEASPLVVTDPLPAESRERSSENPNSPAISMNRGNDELKHKDPSSALSAARSGHRRLTSAAVAEQEAPSVNRRSTSAAVAEQEAPSVNRRLTSAAVAEQEAPSGPATNSTSRAVPPSLLPVTRAAEESPGLVPDAKDGTEPGTESVAASPSKEKDAHTSYKKKTSRLKRMTRKIFRPFKKIRVKLYQTNYSEDVKSRRSVNSLAGAAVESEEQRLDPTSTDDQDRGRGLDLLGSGKRVYKDGESLGDSVNVSSPKYNDSTSLTVVSGSQEESTVAFADSAGGIDGQETSLARSRLKNVPSHYANVPKNKKVRKTKIKTKI